MDRDKINYLLTFSSTNIEISLSMSGFSITLLTFIWLFPIEIIFPELFWITILFILISVFFFIFSFIYFQTGIAILGIELLEEKHFRNVSDCIDKGVNYLKIGILFILLSMFFITFQIIILRVPSLGDIKINVENILIMLVLSTSLILSISYIIRTFLKPIEI